MALSEEQQAAADWFEGPLLVLGTPGSGKTTVIVERIHNLIEKYGVNPGQILVITFTKAAAVSMQERYAGRFSDGADEVRFSTFHAFYYWIIRTAYRDGVSVISETERLNILRGILIGINRDDYDNEETLMAVSSALGRIASDMIDIADYHSTDMADADFRTVYESYRREKRARGVIDFDDMMEMCYKLLTERPDILDVLRRRYRYVMVDEFQDTNKIQYEILKMLVEPVCNLFCVGDDDQSIYGFRGARPDIMLRFRQEFEGAEVKALSLNFRCPKGVTGISSRLISSNRNRYKKELRSAEVNSGHVFYIRTADTMAEYGEVIRRIRESAAKGVPYTEMAVLYRTNRIPQRLIYRLREYNIPYDVRDGVQNIFKAPYVSPVINYLRFAAGDHSRSNFLTFMNKPVRYVPRKLLEDETIDLKRMIVMADKDYLVKNLIDLLDLMKKIEKMTPYAAINYIRKQGGYDRFIRKTALEKGIDGDEIIEMLDEVMSMTKDMGGSPDGIKGGAAADGASQEYMVSADSSKGHATGKTELVQFIEWVDNFDEILKSTASRSGEKTGVQLMTFHGAKGLEFKEVHIIELIDGVVPYKKSKTSAELEEERRMLYVGMTRSSGELCLYAPKMRGSHTCKESRFITKKVLKG